MACLSVGCVRGRNCLETVENVLTIEGRVGDRAVGDRGCGSHPAVHDMLYASLSCSINNDLSQNLLIRPIRAVRGLHESVPYTSLHTLLSPR